MKRVPPPRAPIPPLAWRVVAEVQQRLHDDLDRPWDLDTIAQLAGYDSFHFAHLFRDVVGEPPLRYLRRIRLERAAHELVNDPRASVASAASRAGYRSLEGFSRSFSRLFGRSPKTFRQSLERAGGSVEPPKWRSDLDPSEFPAGLRAHPVIESIGPLHGWTAVTESFDDLEIVARAMMPILEQAPPDGPWQIGGIAQPWGWEADTQRELRVFRLVSTGETPPAPLLPWRLPRGWFARFDYVGPPSGIAGACAWIMGAWIYESGLRVAFAPLFTLLEDPMAFDMVVARIHAPIEPLTTITATTIAPSTSRARRPARRRRRSERRATRRGARGCGRASRS